MIAHDSRKELLAQFCTAYVRILSQNELVATGVTGKVVHDTCGLPVRCLYPGARGGAEHFLQCRSCGEIDMLLFFPRPRQRPALSRTPLPCCACAIPAPSIATNIATAEVLIHGLERGDLASIAAREKITNIHETPASICRAIPHN